MAQSRVYPRYEEDHYGWLQAMIALLKERRMDELDIDHIVEDLEDMARSDVRELISRLAVLIAHLLKWQYQPERRGHSWLGTIHEQRRSLDDLLEENTSLKGKTRASLPRSYRRALAQVERETGLTRFPGECPYTFDQCMDESFFPGDPD
jgi:hypothetical protein